MAIEPIGPSATIASCRFMKFSSPAASGVLYVDPIYSRPGALRFGTRA